MSNNYFSNTNSGMFATRNPGKVVESSPRDRCRTKGHKLRELMAEAKAHGYTLEEWRKLMGVDHEI